LELFSTETTLDPLKPDDANYIEQGREENVLPAIQELGYFTGSPSGGPSSSPAGRSAIDSYLFSKAKLCSRNLHIRPRRLIQELLILISLLSPLTHHH
jgi:hypothetical protein